MPSREILLGLLHVRRIIDFGSGPSISKVFEEVLDDIPVRVVHEFLFVHNFEAEASLGALQEKAKRARLASIRSATS